MINRELEKLVPNEVKLSSAYQYAFKQDDPQESNPRFSFKEMEDNDDSLH